MGLSRVFFRAGKLAFMDDLIYGTPAQMQQIIEKVTSDEQNSFY